MTAADFRRIALSLDGVEEVAHADLPAFRVGGARFASLASQSAGYGNLTLEPEQQAAFVEEAPEIFLPIPGGFGRMGHTHIRLAAASEEVLTGALRTAWKLRIEKNAKKTREEASCGSASGEQVDDLTDIVLISSSGREGESVTISALSHNLEVTNQGGTHPIQ